MNDINLTQADSAVHPYEYAQERGLTKREYFAALFMQAYMNKGIVKMGLWDRLRLFFNGKNANLNIQVSYSENTLAAKNAVRSADALIEALNK